MSLAVPELRTSPNSMLEGPALPIGTRVRVAGLPPEAVTALVYNGVEGVIHSRSSGRHASETYRIDTDGDGPQIHVCISWLEVVSANPDPTPAPGGAS